MNYTMTTEEIRELISGRFTFTKCIDCYGSGRVLYNTRTGLTENFIPQTEDPSDYGYDCCEYCDGLGGRLKFDRI